MPSPSSQTQDRKAWMSLLARAPADRLAALFPDPLPDHAMLRAPEIGSVMVRGRIGGTGAPFNLGEMTVTRCSLRLGDGTVGHAYVQGRDKDHALRAAVVDALMQTGAAAALRGALDRLAAEEAARRGARAAKAAATKGRFLHHGQGRGQMTPDTLTGVSPPPPPTAPAPSVRSSTRWPDPARSGRWTARHRLRPCRLRRAPWP